MEKISAAGMLGSGRSGSGDNQDAQMLDSHDSNEEQGRIQDPNSSENELDDSKNILQKQNKSKQRLAYATMQEESNDEADNNSCLDSFEDDAEDEEEKKANAANLERLQRDFYNKSKKLRDDLMGIQEGNSSGRGKKNEQD